MFGSLKLFLYINYMKYTEEKEKLIIDTCNNEISLRQAAIKLKMNYKTVVLQSKRLGCFKTNQAGKGTKKKPCKIFSLNDILLGKYPGYHTFKLKLRLLKEGLKEHKCEKCNLSEWQGDKIPLELHHIDGKKYNHLIENLQLLCPNCHALTDNYRSKNKIR